ncbi:hypothetical protein AUC71_13410 [Methyloceanibacter marginalis]|uniref:Uncharacterized protein n=1 Tax=Methyloceanibacter marginalis TaxID=1774971 RepID=A0A1E3WAH8_9HYPH|nr:hypothetical protein AUC71_13410 [Methyloceanibacter marginalis]
MSVGHTGVVHRNFLRWRRVVCGHVVRWRFHRGCFGGGLLGRWLFQLVHLAPVSLSSAPKRNAAITKPITMPPKTMNRNARLLGLC